MATARHRRGARSRGDCNGRGDERRRNELGDLAPSELGRLIQTLEESARGATDLRFEYAARLRDRSRAAARAADAASPPKVALVLIP